MSPLPAATGFAAGTPIRATVPRADSGSPSPEPSTSLAPNGADGSVGGAFSTGADPTASAPETNIGQLYWLTLAVIAVVVLVVIWTVLLRWREWATSSPTPLVASDGPRAQARPPRPDHHARQT